MILTETPGFMKRFRRTPWRVQMTFEVPLPNPRKFLAAIVSSMKPPKAGSVTIDTVVFEPTNLKSLLTKYVQPERIEQAGFFHDWSIEAGESQLAELLDAAFRDAVDFVFTPIPKQFAIFADHDEYATFFAITKSHLNRIVKAVTESGATARDYQRVL
jgi:hypothetical protein